eukprot:scaffold16508_cov133-Amphora_coffeaeformis.AAC.1
MLTAAGYNTMVQLPVLYLSTLVVDHLRLGLASVRLVLNHRHLLTKSSCNMSENKNKKKQHSEEEKVNFRRQPSKLDNARIRQMLQDEESLQKHLQPLFHAMLRGSPLQEQQQQQQQQQQEQEQKQKTKQSLRQKEAEKLQRQPTSAQKQVPPSRQTDSVATTPPPKVPIDDYIPHNPQEIRQTALFSQLYRLIQFQRDQYLVGSEYATWQHNERQQQSSNTTDNSTTAGGGWIIQTDPNDRLPYDPTSLGHQQLARVAADFIPTATVRHATVPLLTPLATETLYPQLKQACNDVILGQQANLNQIVKDSLLAFLKNPQNRMAIKKTTSYRLDSFLYNENGNGE